MLRRARDQVAGGRHQPDAEGDGERAEQRRRARRGRAGSPASASSRRSVVIATASAVLTIAPASIRTTRSARSASSGRCAMSSTVRPRREPLDASPTSSRARRVEVRGRLVEDHERGVAEERAGERDAPALAGRDAAARRRRRASRSRRGSAGDEARRRPRERAAARTRSSLGAGIAEADVVGDRSAEQRRALRHPGDAARARRRDRTSARSHPADDDPATRSARAKRSRSDAIVLLPAPLGPTSATVSPGASSRSTSSSTSSAAPG